MKFKKFFTALAFSSLAVAGALFVSQSIQGQKAKVAKATTGVVEIEIKEIRDGISTDKHLYPLPIQNYEMPPSWDHVYTAVGEDDGVYINDVKQVGATLKYVDVGSVYYNLFYEMPNSAVEGDVVEFKGSFASETSGYSFSVHYATQRFAGHWIHALEAFDTVSLADANMPDLGSEFASPNNSTDALFGAQANYVTDPAGLPKQTGFFGLTNNTGSYAFQFYYEKASGNDGWFDVLIGASGTLYSTGHFIDFAFLDAWADTGHAQIHEMVGSGDNWTKNVVQTTAGKVNIPLGWNPGEKNLLEMGVIKVRDYEDLHYLFFKVNGNLKWGDYWELEDGGMTTKVCMVNATGTSVSVTNSLEPESVRLPSVASYVPAAKQVYLNMSKDACPAVNNWDDYFMPVVASSLTLNSSSVGYSNWNYFKKTGSTQMFLALGDIGITPAQGDILYIGGMFKAARTVNGVKVLFKVNFADSYFQFDGEKWIAFNPNYSIADFSYNLLKMTCGICSASDDGNHDALAAVWTTLSGDSHYGQLTDDQKTELGSAVADPTVEVPTVVEEIEDLLPEDAVGAAMYRYDYCTGKYALSEFISGRAPLPFASSTINNNLSTENSSTMIIVIAIAATTALAFTLLLVFKKKKQK